MEKVTEKLLMEKIQNWVREARERRGWTQQELADRAGVSRAGVSAIEMGRLIPSTAAALALAGALALRVEDLFSLPRADLPEWAWIPLCRPARFWHAQVADRMLVYPVEPTSAPIPHDGVAAGAVSIGTVSTDAELAARTLVVAGCDPAAGLLASLAGQQEGLRMLPLVRGSGSALALLEQNLVHVAGVHLGGPDPDRNATLIRQRLGPGYSLLRLSTWESGIVIDPSRDVSSIGSVVASDLRWIGREPGSGARQCLDEVLGGRCVPMPLARDHRGVVEAIRLGFADVGVCVRVVSEESGLGFLSVRREVYDLCFKTTLATDWRMRALIRVIQSTAYNRLFADLPGYTTTDRGAIQET